MTVASTLGRSDLAEMHRLIRVCCCPSAPINLSANLPKSDKVRFARHSGAIFGHKVIAVPAGASLA